MTVISALSKKNTKEQKEVSTHKLTKIQGTKNKQTVIQQLKGLKTKEWPTLVLCLKLNMCQRFPKHWLKPLRQATDRQYLWTLNTLRHTMLRNTQSGKLITGSHRHETEDTQAIYNAAEVDWRLLIGRFGQITATPITDASELETGSRKYTASAPEGPIPDRESHSRICITGRITHGTQHNEYKLHGSQRFK